MGSVSELLGKTLSEVEKVGDDELIFTLEGGKKYRMYHDQECCEGVSIEDIVGDLDDLVGSPLAMAEETTSDVNPEGVTKDCPDDSFTWTFYRFATMKGYVTIRWYGSSNGC
jgi:hypothetical protein